MIRIFCAALLSLSIIGFVGPAHAQATAKSSNKPATVSDQATTKDTGATTTKSETGGSSSASSQTTTKGKWNLVWSDEFNGSGLPNPALWVMEEGMPRFDNEQMFRANPKNCRLEDGNLVLEARQERVVNDRYIPGSSDPRTARPYADYTSCNIFPRMAFKYGRFEVLAQLPSGFGVHPGIWLNTNDQVMPYVMQGYSAPSESNSEIDLVETIGNNNNQLNNVYTTLHWLENTRPGTLHNKTYVVNNIPNFHDNFHLFVVEWSPENIKIWIDDVLVKDFDVNAINAGNNHQYFRKEMLLLFTMQISNQFGWASVPNPASYPAKTKIAYARVYQKSNGTGSTGGGSNSGNGSTGTVSGGATTGTIGATIGTTTGGIKSNYNSPPPAPAITAPAPIAANTNGLKSSRINKCAPYGRNFEARRIEYQGKKVLRCFRKDIKSNTATR